MFKNIDETLNFVMNRRRGDSSFFDFKELMNELGNPQNHFYMVHVAGTDGKGSTVSYLRDLLMSQGFKVGTLQSPHYITHLDRIRVNNQNIREESFISIINRYYDLIIEKGLSMFEIDFLVMCEYFKEENIDIAIVEVGLGGRLDSTNVIDNPKLSIVTTIGYDHMDRLGNTLEEICREKCGIIKGNSKVLVGYLNDNLKDIVKDIADKRHSDYYELGEYKMIKPGKFEYEDKSYTLKSLAKYQVHNASLALDALNIIAGDYPFVIDEEKARKALATSFWNGRFEFIHKNPNIILDGGHNIHGIAALCESFDQLSGNKMIIFSALKRKEYKKMCEMLMRHTDRLVVTSFNSYESINIDDIDFDVEKTDDYIEEINSSLGKFDNILICGSLYFISEVVSRIDEIHL